MPHHTPFAHIHQGLGFQEGLRRGWCIGHGKLHGRLPDLLHKLCWLLLPRRPSCLNVLLQEVQQSGVNLVRLQQQTPHQCSTTRECQMASLMHPSNAPRLGRCCKPHVPCQPQPSAILAANNAPARVPQPPPARPCPSLPPQTAVLPFTVGYCSLPPRTPNKQPENNSQTRLTSAISRIIAFLSCAVSSFFMRSTALMLDATAASTASRASSRYCRSVSSSMSRSSSGLAAKRSCQQHTASQQHQRPSQSRCVQQPRQGHHAGAVLRCNLLLLQWQHATGQLARA